MRGLITLLILLLFLAACAGPTGHRPPTSTPVPSTATPYPTPQPEEAPSPTTLVQGPRMATFQSEDGITLGGTL